MGCIKTLHTPCLKLQLKRGHMPYGLHPQVLLALLMMNGDGINDNDNSTGWFPFFFSFIHSKDLALDLELV